MHRIGQLSQTIWKVNIIAAIPATSASHYHHMQLHFSCIKCIAKKYVGIGQKYQSNQSKLIACKRYPAWMIVQNCLASLSVVPPKKTPKCGFQSTLPTSLFAMLHTKRLVRREAFIELHRIVESCSLAGSDGISTHTGFVCRGSAHSRRKVN